MAYSVHDFHTGDKILASDINEMDDQIKENSDKIDSKLLPLTGGVMTGAIYELSGNGTASIVSRSTISGQVKGTTPSSIAYYPALIWEDTAASNVGYIRARHDTSGNMQLQQTVIGQNGSGASAYLSMSSSGVPRFYVPTPPSTDNTTSAATTEWVNSYANSKLLPLTGGSMTGSIYELIGSGGVGLACQTTASGESKTASPSSTVYYPTVVWKDSNATSTGFIRTQHDSNGTMRVIQHVYGQNGGESNAWLEVDSSNVARFHVPTPPATDSTTSAVTTAWMNADCGTQAAFTSNTLSGIATYPTKPGLYRVTGTLPDGMPAGASGYGVLSIMYAGEYVTHQYIDVNNVLYWAHTGKGVTAPTSWNRPARVGRYTYTTTAAGSSAEIYVPVSTARPFAAVALYTDSYKFSIDKVLAYNNQNHIHVTFDASVAAGATIYVYYTINPEEC